MKILNYGSLNIDYTYDVEHFVRDGETISADRMEIFSGGKGLNQSVALSKSGVQVWHGGAVGSSDGEFLVDQLKEAGVHTELIQRISGKTGHAIIQRNPQGGNCILLYGGANQEITREMADKTLEMFGRGDYLILQNEISQMAYIMEKAHEKAMKIVMNPSPMNGRIRTYPLEYVDWFILNEVEGADLCEEAEGETLVKRLAERFPHARIVLTLGSRGALCWDGSQVLAQRAYRVEAVDTTAAGDTFTGYFMGGIVQGLSETAALDRAARAASIAVTRPGAAPSIPWKDEVDR